jgi:hypothetical protein
MESTGHFGSGVSAHGGHAIAGGTNLFNDGAEETAAIPAVIFVT